MRVTALHKVGRQDGGRLRPQCAGRVSNLEPTIGLPPWYQERPGSAKTRGMACTWAADTPPCLFFFLFFCSLPLFHFLFLPPPFSPPPPPTPPPPPRPAFLSLFSPLLRHAVEQLVPLWCTYVSRCCGDVFPFLVLTLELSRRRQRRDALHNDLFFFFLLNEYCRCANIRIKIFSHKMRIV